MTLSDQKKIMKPSYNILKFFITGRSGSKIDFQFIIKSI